MRSTSKAPSARSKSMILKRLRTRFGIPAALLAVLALALPAGASADALGANSEFFEPEAPNYPVALVEGSDGNVWFTDPASPALTGLKIGKVTPAGVVNEYSPGLSGAAWGIADGPDGNIWFTEPTVKKVGHIKPSEPTTSLVEIEVPGMPTEVFYKSLITAGPDGNLWVSLGVNGIARITPGGTVTEFKTGLNAEAEVCSIAAGPDGNVWFGDCSASKPSVGSITPGGTITEYEVKGESGNFPESIAAGSDGRLWFPASNAADERIGAITTSGTVTYYKTPTFPGSFGLDSLTLGPDGNIWGAETYGENEKQTVTIKGESGPFKLGFEGKETGWTGTAKTTSGSTSVTGITTSTGAISKNEAITGTGIKAGTRITACNPSTCIPPLTSITLSQAAEATGEPSLSADLAITANTNTYSTTTVKEALEKLSTIGKNVSVGGSGSIPTVIRSPSFVGKFERSDVALMTCDGSKLTGGSEPGCTVTTAVEAFTNRLFRIKPSGAMKGFALKPATSLQASVKANALTAGPGGNIWYTSAGLPPAIGKFGTEAKTLTIKKEGTGDGVVISSPSGIECGETCEADFENNTVVTLKASPDAESLFTSWKGCDVGGANGRECKVTMSANKTVSVKFTRAYDVSVTRKGTGLGKVGSSPGGVLCLSNCSSTSAKFKEQTNVTLTATPSKHFTFTGWSGDCSGTGTCVLSALSADKAVEAEFTELAKYDLTVTKTGGGQGTVKAKQAGINCGATCFSMAAAYYQGEAIELLVPVPSKGSTFAGWSGSGCSGTGTCVVTMSSAKSVEAKFE